MNQAELSAQDKQQITESILAGRKIDAIKQYREITGLGLKEAKDFIDQFTTELSKTHPEIVQVNRSGCGSAAVVLIGLCITAYWVV
jgi:ribosomal protein L7/L12